VFTEEFKEEAVQMLLDGHTAKSIVDRLGLSGTSILYRWKSQQLQQSGPVASSLEARVRELEVELRRRPSLRVGARRERDVLKKALAIFGRNE
jgi:transposase